MNLASRILSFVALLGALVSGMPPVEQAGSCQTAQPKPASHRVCNSSIKGGECCCQTAQVKQPSCHQMESFATKKQDCQCLKSSSAPAAEKAAPTLEKPQAHDVALLVEPLLVTPKPLLAVKAKFTQDSPRIRGPDTSSVHLRAPPIC